MDSKSIYIRPNAKKRMARPEEIIQRPLIKMLQQINMLTGGKVYFFHIPNQLLNKSSLRKIYHGLGIQSGIPDLVIMFQGGKTIFIELKADRTKGGTKKPSTTEKQDEVHDALRNLGFNVYVLAARDAVEAQKKLLAILEENGLRDHGITIF